jgi:ubiquitin-protein ligase
LKVGESYPEEPPEVRFIDQMYHLNVEYKSGVVHMAILEDDWSPFLNVSAIFDSLDQLL